MVSRGSRIFTLARFQIVIGDSILDFTYPCLMTCIIISIFDRYGTVQMIPLKLQILYNSNMKEMRCISKLCFL